MNILVHSLAGNVYFRPDITLVKESGDYYFPPFVEKFSIVPVLFLRISKAGKTISPKFAERYYDALSYGALLYPQNLIKDGESFAMANCLNYTSLLPYPLFDSCTLEIATNKICIKKQNSAKQVQTVWETSVGELCKQGSFENIQKLVAEKLAHVSNFASLKIGDFIAIELSQAQNLASVENQFCQLDFYYCDRHTASFNLNF